jgi:hypothetical protein
MLTEPAAFLSHTLRHRARRLLPLKRGDRLLEVVAFRSLEAAPLNCPKTEVF